MKVQYIFALLINYAASVAAVGSYHPTASFTQTKPLVFRKWHGSYWDIQLLKKGDVDEIRCTENSTQIVCNPGWVRAYGMRYSIGYMLDNNTVFLKIEGITLIQKRANLASTPILTKTIF